MTWLNFVIIGAQKDGTSSLFRYLYAHPLEFMSCIKEPKYFGLDRDESGFKGHRKMQESVARISDVQ